MDTWLIIVLVVLAVLVLFFLYGYFKLKTVSIQASSENIIILNDKNFQSSLRNGVFIVDFWAEWCGPCRMLIPVFNQLADEKDTKYKVAKLNVDESRQTASKYGIRSIPTVIVFKNGKEVKRFVGLKSKNFYKEYLQSL